MSNLAPWPPAITEEQLQALTLQATTYALSHGLVYLPIAEKQPPAPTSTIHAPLALFPSPIPRTLFERARALQRTYNILYARIASDVAFLDRVMGADEGVGRADAFTGELWRRWRRVRDEGVARPLQLGLFRSDYMVHLPDSKGPASLKQVEFNTISSSFGTLSQRVAALHRYLFKSTGYYGSSASLKEENFPANETTAGLAEGLAAAHAAYGVKNAWILFVVQEGERNVFDQRWLEYELLEGHGIHVVRQTFAQLAKSASVDPTSRVLRIDAANLPDVNGVEIATVYFRAGYTPTDYPTAGHYDTRYVLESSRAIQCPSIPLQLAGGKKVQEVLTTPDVLESFLHDVPQAELASLRESWMAMWALDDSGDAGVQRARAEHTNLVLKPQREGGGNNVYKEAIPPFLDALPAAEREAWIAMELIRTPEGLGNYLVRAGGGTDGAVKAEVISELGIFGWALFGGADGRVEEREVGWLVRTKGKDSNEGGVAAGFSVLDSIVLVD
ncbi:glutathione synthetase [Phanerochaete sordida]|uniref:Glutathione synthetase n=1 Tax=Phanerochaete sordida TaxID=48140 RepID=A0A9P3GF36_9APHY|nr:glutathione synthetase [Phanerochaete sordida]